MLCKNYVHIGCHEGERICAYCNEIINHDYCEFHGEQDYHCYKAKEDVKSANIYFVHVSCSDGFKQKYPKLVQFYSSDE